MKSEFKAKLIRHMLGKKDSEKGFTLIELLVVIIIIGILAAIALPSFLNQANKARQSEAKTYTGSMNRAQQAYYLEKQRFSLSDVSSLGLGIKTLTDNYGYTIQKGAVVASTGTPGTPATVTAGSDPGAAGTDVFAYATPIVNNLKGYAGYTWVGGSGNDRTTLANLCEMTTPGLVVSGAQAAASTDSTASCAAGMESIK